jgi:hypothetical protein
MATVVTAPNKYNAAGKVIVFLAGSIEQGEAEDWQTRLVTAGRKLTASLTEFDNLLVLNPRRDEWDKTWKQDKDFGPFNEQVNWELKGQEDADVIAMCFVPETKSPITLLELGLFADDRLIVFCPEGFWRKGNVDIVCERYGITQASSWEDFEEKVKEKIRQAESKLTEKVWDSSPL